MKWQVVLRVILFIPLLLLAAPAEEKKQVHIALYIRENCFYCAKVTTELRKLNKNIEIRNIASTNHKNQLKKIGGKIQVPCLFINNSPLYESDEIIKWLKSNQDMY